jgi:hypothetical protein
MGRSAVVPLVLALVLVACGDDEGSSAATEATVDAEASPFCDAFGGLLVGPLAEGGFDAEDPEQLAAAVQ